VRLLSFRFNYFIELAKQMEWFSLKLNGLPCGFLLTADLLFLFTLQRYANSFVYYTSFKQTKEGEEKALKIIKKLQPYKIIIPDTVKVRLVLFQIKERPGFQEYFHMVGEPPARLNPKDMAGFFQVDTYAGEQFRTCWIVDCQTQAEQQVVLKRGGGIIFPVIIGILGDESQVHHGISNTDKGVFKTAGGGPEIVICFIPVE